MRTAFIESLIECAEENKNIWLLTADLGFSVLEAFKDKFPDRFINIGVAEQNMTGIAAGLALSGKKVFTYSIANFPTLRCLEQIRNDVCYHNLNVNIVAVGGGLSYGTLGYTHHGIEDLAIMRALPNITVTAPGDPIETRAVTNYLVSKDGPGYLRLGKAGESIVHKSHISLNAPIILTEQIGYDINIFSTGATLLLAKETALALTKQNLNVGLHSVPVLKPFDLHNFLQIARDSKLIITIEEHKTGALGSIAAEELALNNIKTPIKVFRLPDHILHTLGTQDYLRNKCGLTTVNILRETVQIIESLKLL
jgi:transketolase